MANSDTQVEARTALNTPSSASARLAAVDSGGVQAGRKATSIADEKAGMAPAPALDDRIELERNKLAKDIRDNIDSPLAIQKQVTGFKKFLIANGVPTEQLGTELDTLAQQGIAERLYSQASQGKTAFNHEQVRTLLFACGITDKAKQQEKIQETGTRLIDHLAATKDPKEIEHALRIAEMIKPKSIFEYKPEGINSEQVRALDLATARQLAQLSPGNVKDIIAGYWKELIHLGVDKESADQKVLGIGHLVVAQLLTNYSREDQRMETRYSLRDQRILDKTYKKNANVNDHGLRVLCREVLEACGYRGTNAELNEIIKKDAKELITKIQSANNPYDKSNPFNGVDKVEHAKFISAIKRVAEID